MLATDSNIGSVLIFFLPGIG